MREAGRQWRGWILAGTVALAAAVALWGRNPFAQSSRDAILNSARRLNGDVMVLSLDYPPPDIEEVHNLTAVTAGVVDASIVAI
jgi:hypothetical protein